MERLSQQRLNESIMKQCSTIFDTRGPCANADKQDVTLDADYTCFSGEVQDLGRIATRD